MAVPMRPKKTDENLVDLRSFMYRVMAVASAMVIIVGRMIRKM